ncbi:hypothetical protein CASFOL_019466 [Castilleja foliolosa]|uniref:BHLH domain-containing protein n=1 Tax=Castilleja foliolosa TaxID=1961234 RepID=A0ABD3D587_9LAMI
MVRAREPEACKRIVATIAATSPSYWYLRFRGDFVVTIGLQVKARSRELFGATNPSNKCTGAILVSIGRTKVLPTKPVSCSEKINAMYSTLRSLLPPEDNLRKLSIPNTVSRMINYIPELQQEVEILGKKKETLIMSSSNISKVDESFIPKSKKTKLNQSSSSSSSMVSAMPINDREIVFHISTSKTEKRSISEILMRFENEGFITINVASFESFDGRVFYNLHLQAQESEVPMDAEILKKKAWPF